MKIQWMSHLVLYNFHRFVAATFFRLFLYHFYYHTCFIYITLVEEQKYTLTVTAVYCAINKQSLLKKQRFDGHVSKSDINSIF